MDDNGEKTSLNIFAREPIPGKVKTRLLENLSPSKVTRLYKAFIQDVAREALGVRCCCYTIFYAGPGNIPFLGRFKKRFSLRKQSSGDLGVRMYKAFRESKKKGSQKTVVVGTDSPHLTSQRIQKAFKALSVYDVVLGPCHDGGYYLIALRVPNKKIFSGIPWGTGGVLDATLAKAKKLKKKVFLLPKMSDIDDYRSLKRFMAKKVNKSNAQETWKIIRRLKIR